MSDVTEAAKQVAVETPGLTHEGLIAKVARLLDKAAHEIRDEIMEIADDLGLHHTQPVAEPTPEPAPVADVPPTEPPVAGDAPETVTP